MIRRLLLAVSLIGLCLLASPNIAQARDLYSGVDCGKAGQSAVCNDRTGKDPLTGKDGVLADVTNIIAYIGGAAAIIVIIIAGIRFTTSGSDISTNSRTDTDVENARKTLTYALVGLAVIVLARTIILYVLGKT